MRRLVARACGVPWPAKPARQTGHARVKARARAGFAPPTGRRGVRGRGRSVSRASAQRSTEYAVRVGECHTETSSPGPALRRVGLAVQTYERAVLVADT